MYKCDPFNLKDICLILMNRSLEVSTFVDWLE